MPSFTWQCPRRRLRRACRSERLRSSRLGNTRQTPTSVSSRRLVGALQLSRQFNVEEEGRDAGRWVCESSSSSM